MATPVSAETVQRSMTITLENPEEDLWVARFTPVAVEALTSAGYTVTHPADAEGVTLGAQTVFVGLDPDAVAEVLAPSAETLRGLVTLEGPNALRQRVHAVLKRVSPAGQETARGARRKTARSRRRRRTLRHNALHRNVRGHNVK